MIHIDKSCTKLMGSTKLLLAELSQGISDLIRSQAEAEGKPIKSLAPVLLSAITGAVVYSLNEDQKRNAAE